MEFERRRYNHSYMNIAPLVDVVFLLLLFFMLTSRLIREPTLKVRLPESKTAATEQETIRTITITRGGRIFFMDREIRLKGRSEEHTSELQSHSFISYAVFCLKKKKTHNKIRF